MRKVLDNHLSLDHFHVTPVGYENEFIFSLIYYFSFTNWVHY